jgi:hypothetical protein
MRLNSFFENIDRFMSPSYIPTQADVLRARVRSTGIEEAEFKFEDISFRMVVSRAICWFSSSEAMFGHI